MTHKRFLSRRELVAALFIPQMAALAPSSSDARLIALGREFDEVAARVDQAISDVASDSVSDSDLERLGQLDAEIVATPATKIDGMRVKARAACWALLGDLEPNGETTNQRMALSIVRDLIRLYDPRLEDPDALGALVAEFV